MPRLEKDCHAYILNAQRKNNQNRDNNRANDQNHHNNQAKKVNKTTQPNHSSNLMKTGQPLFNPQPTNITPMFNPSYMPNNFQTTYPNNNFYPNNYYNGFPTGGYPSGYQSAYPTLPQFNNYTMIQPNIIQNYQFNNIENAFFYPNNLFPMAPVQPEFSFNPNLTNFIRNEHITQNFLSSLPTFGGPQQPQPYMKGSFEQVKDVEKNIDDYFQQSNQSYFKRKSSHDLDSFNDISKKKPMVDPLLPNH